MSSSVPNTKTTCKARHCCPILYSVINTNVFDNFINKLVCVAAALLVMCNFSLV